MNRRAFSLIEILISILILALGLLGLGALFPVVIREQRASVDSFTAAFVVRQAETALSSAVRWENGIPPLGSAQPNPLTGERSRVLSLLLDRASGAATPTYPYTSPGNEPTEGLGEGYNPNSTVDPPPRQLFEYGQWHTSTVIQQPAGTAETDREGDAVLGLRRPAGTNTPYSGVDPASGATVTLQIPPDRTYMRIPLRDRVFPPAGEGALQPEPQLVWDFAVQRVPTFALGRDPTGDALRAAVFVRRIDPRIRSGQNSVRRAIFSLTLPPAERRLPLGEEAPSGGDWMSFAPTGDGTDGSAGGGLRYCGVKACSVEFWYDPESASPALAQRDRLYFPASSASDPRWSSWSAGGWRAILATLRQPGQKIVDNLGNVYTVVGGGNEPDPAVQARDIDTEPGADYIRIDPPVPAAVTAEMARTAGNRGYTPGTATERRRRAVWQICFTPQVPVAVEVVDVPKSEVPQ